MPCVVEGDGLTTTFWRWTWSVNIYMVGICVSLASVLPHERLTMRSASFIRVLPIALAGLVNVCAAGQSPAYDMHAKQRRSTATIHAVSTSVHMASGNQEVYLADVSFKGTAHQLAKLVDTYSSGGSPILRSVLLEQRLLQMTLIRNPSCDATGQSFFLGASDSNIFDMGTRRTLKEHASETIPCFTVVHDATQLAK
jgi:hypothetical protein